MRVIAGLMYSEQSQVFNRWLLPSDQTSFHWTGNRPDAEDATTWVFNNAVGCVRLPELVSIVDGCIADATLEAASRHDASERAVGRGDRSFAIALSGPRCRMSELFM